MLGSTHTHAHLSQKSFSTKKRSSTLSERASHGVCFEVRPATQNRPVPCPKLVRGLTSFASTLEVRADPASWDWLPPCPNLPPEVRADPAFWDQLVTCPKMFFEVRADPVSWDQLVPCPRNSVLEVGPDPDFQYQLVPCPRFVLRYDLPHRTGQYPAPN